MKNENTFSEFISGKTILLEDEILNLPKKKTPQNPPQKNKTPQM